DNSRSRATVNLESVSRPQRLPPPGGVVAFFSCSEGERAFEHEKLKHGVFFHFVIEALSGVAVGPGESEVLVPDLEKFVKKKVRDYVREMYGERQLPEMKNGSRDLVPLVRLSRPRGPDTAPARPTRPGGLPAPFVNTLGMTLARIPAGEFLM